MRPVGRGFRRRLYTGMGPIARGVSEEFGLWGRDQHRKAERRKSKNDRPIRDPREVPIPSYRWQPDPSITVRTTQGPPRHAPLLTIPPSSSLP